jgi:DNA-binding MarR family transcriptional regulator
VKPEAASTQEAISQSRPFQSPAQEGVVALLLAAEVLRRRFDEVVRAGTKLTHQQYNVLRILRGAGPAGLPTLAIAERMIEHTPGVTRLIDRLEAKGLVERNRSSEDRRQVVCRLSAKGARVLGELDEPVDRLDEEVLACLSKARLKDLIHSLNRVRVHNARP